MECWFRRLHRWLFGWIHSIAFLRRYHSELRDSFLVARYLASLMFPLIMLYLLKRLCSVVYKSRINSTSHCKRNLTLLTYRALSLLMRVYWDIMCLLVGVFSPWRLFPSWGWALRFFGSEPTHIDCIWLLIPFPAMLRGVVIIGHRLPRA